MQKREGLLFFRENILPSAFSELPEKKIAQEECLCYDRKESGGKVDFAGQAKEKRRIKEWIY